MSLGLLQLFGGISLFDGVDIFTTLLLLMALFVSANNMPSYFILAACLLIYPYLWKHQQDMSLYHICDWTDFILVTGVFLSIRCPYSFALMVMTVIHIVIGYTFPAFNPFEIADIMLASWAGYWYYKNHVFNNRTLA